MKNLKKYLALFALVVACCCCLVSCSCFGGKGGDKNSDGSDDSQDGGDSQEQTTVYCTVDVDFVTAKQDANADEKGGSYSSSTGTNRHAKGSAVTYSFEPKAGFKISYIKLDDEDYFVYENNEEAGNSGVEIEFEEIDDDHDITVKFEARIFEIVASVVEDKYSSSAGGTIALSDPSGYFKGATTPTVTLTPNTGYVIYSVLINGEKYFKYEEQKEQASQALVIPFENICENYSLEIRFYKVVEIPEALLTNTVLSTNEFGDDVALEKTPATTTVLFESLDGNAIPEGSEVEIKLNVKDNYELVELQLKLDAFNYTDKFPANVDYEETDFSYNARTKTIRFSSLSLETVIVAYTKGVDIELIVYNAGERESDILTRDVNSSFIVSAEHATFDWYYSTSRDYTEPTVWIPLELSESTNPLTLEKVYYIVLSEDLISEAKKSSENDCIILIYSQSE